MEPEIAKILDEAGYEYCSYSGCFDILAKKESEELDMLLLKVLGNIDSFQFSHSMDLKTVSSYLDAFGFVIGKTTRKESLEDNIIYERFGVPAITPKTLGNILLRNERLFLCRFRGGLFSEIDPGKMRENRKRSSMSQTELAEKIGVTKKNVYEHEKKNMLSRHDTVMKVEKLIGSVSAPISFRREFALTETKAGGFAGVVSSDLKKLGFETSAVDHAPFNIAAKNESLVVFSEAEEKQKRLEKKIPYITNFSRITEKPVIIVTKEETDLDAPYILEKELKDFRSANEFKKAIKKR